MAIFSANTTNQNNETICMATFDSEIYVVLQQFQVLPEYNGGASTIFKEKHLQLLRNCYRAVRSQKHEFSVSPRTENRVVYCKCLSAEDYLKSIESIGIALAKHGELFIKED